MLPSLNLLLGDSGTAELTTGAAALESDAAPGAFADELGFRIATASDVVSASGEFLPQTGNALPVFPGISGSVGDRPADPEAIVASLNREIEALSGSEDGELAAVALSGTAHGIQTAVLSEIRGDMMTASETDVGIDVTIGNKAFDSAQVAMPSGLTELKLDPTQPVAVRPLQPLESGKLKPVRPPVAPGLDAVREPQPDRSAVDHRLLVASSRPDIAASMVRPESTSPNADNGTQIPLTGNELKGVLPAMAERASGDSLQSAVPQSPVASPSSLSLPDIALSNAVQGRVAAEPAQSTTAPLPMSTITLPVQAADWDSRFADRIVFMANSKLQNAEIRLTPAELGPLRIRLSIEGGEANIAFVAQQSITRDAIEQALPRLREMLAENGLSLGETSVGGEDVAEGQRDSDRPQDQAVAASVGDDVELETPLLESSARQRAANGLVDTFV